RRRAVSAGRSFLVVQVQSHPLLSDLSAVANPVAGHAVKLVRDVIEKFDFPRPAECLRQLATSCCLFKKRPRFPHAMRTKLRAEFIRNGVEVDSFRPPP